MSLWWLMQHFPRLGFNATALDSVGSRCKAAPRIVSGASWRGTGKVCHGRSWHEAWESPLSRRLWHNLLYASIIAGDEMPDDVGLERPAWWKRGYGLSILSAPPAEAIKALDHDDADPEQQYVEAGGKKKAS